MKTENSWLRAIGFQSSRLPLLPRRYLLRPRTPSCLSPFVLHVPSFFLEHAAFSFPLAPSFHRSRSVPLVFDESLSAEALRARIHVHQPLSCSFLLSASLLALSFSLYVTLCVFLYSSLSIARFFCLPRSLRSRRCFSVRVIMCSVFLCFPFSATPCSSSLFFYNYMLAGSLSRIVLCYSSRMTVSPILLLLSVSLCFPHALRLLYLPFFSSFHIPLLLPSSLGKSSLSPSRTRLSILSSSVSNTLCPLVLRPYDSPFSTRAPPFPRLSPSPDSLPVKRSSERRLDSPWPLGFGFKPA